MNQLPLLPIPPAEIALMKTRIETIGYTGLSPQEFERRLTTNPNYIVIDTRRVPWSNSQVYYRRDTLQAHLGTRYVPLGAWWGNVNYRQPELGIQLADPDRGVQKTLPYLLAGKTLLLLCTCKQEYQDDSVKCHRVLVRQRLFDALDALGVKEEGE